MANTTSATLSLRIEPRLQCPRCKRYNLIRSDNMDIYFYCPDISCGYIMRNRSFQHLGEDRLLLLSHDHIISKDLVSGKPSVVQ